MSDVTLEVWKAGGVWVVDANIGSRIVCRATSRVDEMSAIKTLAEVLASRLDNVLRAVRGDKPNV